MLHCDHLVSPDPPELRGSGQYFTAHAMRRPIQPPPPPAPTHPPTIFACARQVNGNAAWTPSRRPTRRSGGSEVDAQVELLLLKMLFSRRQQAHESGGLAGLCARACGLRAARAVRAVGARLPRQRIGLRAGTGSDMVPLQGNYFLPVRWTRVACMWYMS